MFKDTSRSICCLVVIFTCTDYCVLVIQVYIYISLYFFQTIILALLMKYLGHKQAIVFGLLFESIQLACYGFGSEDWWVNSVFWLSWTIVSILDLSFFVCCPLMVVKIFYWELIKEATISAQSSIFVLECLYT